MPDYLRLPNGSLFPIKDGESDQEARLAALEKYPEAFGLTPSTPISQAESGFLPALKAGVAGLKSDVAALAGRTGLMDEAAAEKYRAEQEAYQQKVFKPTEEGWTEAPFTKAVELLGGSLPYMAAPVAAGAAAAFAPVSAPVAAGLGMGPQVLRRLRSSPDLTCLARLKKVSGLVKQNWALLL